MTRSNRTENNIKKAKFLIVNLCSENCDTNNKEEFARKLIKPTLLLYIFLVEQMYYSTVMLLYFVKNLLPKHRVYVLISQICGI
jgi:hypothetical protein